MLKNIINYYSDREYYSNIVRIGFPIFIQQLAFSGLNMLAIVMVGQKGEASVARWG